MLGNEKQGNGTLAGLSRGSACVPHRRIGCWQFDAVAVTKFWLVPNSRIAVGHHPKSERRVD
jgi:hypothetical protein